MKLFSVLAAVTISHALATIVACEIDGANKKCTTDNCKYVHPVPAIAAVDKDQFRCSVPAPLYQCINGKTVQSPSVEEQKELAKLCLDGGAITEYAYECTNRNAKCKVTKIQSRKGKIEAQPAKCIPKTCSDYAQDENMCSNEPNCVFTPSRRARPIVFKIKCQPTKDASGETKDRCQGAYHPNCASGNRHSTGGPACCTSAIEREERKKAPQTCLEKGSGCVNVATSVFAAAAAALLM